MIRFVPWVILATVGAGLLALLPLARCPACVEVYEEIIGDGEPEPLALGCVTCGDRRRVGVITRRMSGGKSRHEALSNPWIRGMVGGAAVRAGVPDWDVRGADPVNTRAAVPVLCRALATGRESVNNSAAGLLRKIGPEAREAVPAVVDVLRKAAWERQVRAAIVLGDIGSRDAVPALMEGLRDPTPLVRWACAYSLDVIGAPSKAALAPLMTGLRDADRRVRVAIVSALGKLGPEARIAIPALEELARDTEDEDLADRARAAVKELRDGAGSSGVPASPPRPARP